MWNFYLFFDPPAARGVGLRARPAGTPPHPFLFYFLSNGGRFIYFVHTQAPLCVVMSCTRGYTMNTDSHLMVVLSMKTVRGVHEHVC